MKKDLLLRGVKYKRTRELPKYLNCPYCPSQSFPVGENTNSPIQIYKCHAHHTFCIEKEKQ